MKKFEITEEQIKTLHARSGSVEELLERMFPAAFNPEWEEVPLGELLSMRGVYIRQDASDGSWHLIIDAEINSDIHIRDGKICRRTP